MGNILKKINRSKRGLTFALEDEALIGTKFRYIIQKESSEILIVPDINGDRTVSRKKSGQKFKPLYDIRSEEVRRLVSSADYMEVEDSETQIIVHVYKKASAVQKLVSSKLISIGDILCRETGMVVLDRAVGASDPTILFGRPTLANEEYFQYLTKSYWYEY